MPQFKSDRLFIAALADVLVLAAAGSGFAIGRVTRMSPSPTPTPIPTPIPTPVPTPTPEPRAGISDFAGLFAKMDKNLFPTERYRTLPSRFSDCTAHPGGDFTTYFPDAVLTEGESTALQQFMLSSATMMGLASPYPFQGPQNASFHEVLTTAVLNCPSAQ